MRKVKSKLFVISGVILGMAIVCSIALAQITGPVTNAVVGPLPPPPIPPNLIKLTPVEQLGKFMLYDHTLSNPSGYACATCHVLQTGFTGPNSEVNLFGGNNLESCPAGSAIASPRCMRTLPSLRALIPIRRPMGPGSSTKFLATSSSSGDSSRHRVTATRTNDPPQVSLRLTCTMASLRVSRRSSISIISGTSL
jgi:hypothetical protein